MGGGGGKQTSTTTQQVPRELRGAYSTIGNLATDVFRQAGDYLPGMFLDQTPQQVAGATDLENLAYQTAGGMLQSGGPESWSQAQGMFNALGNLPSWSGVNFSGIPGFSAPAPVVDPRRSATAQTGVANKAMQIGGDSGGGQPSGGGQSGGGDSEEPSVVLPGAGSATAQAPTPSGTVPPPWTGATPHGGISAPGMGSGTPTGSYMDSRLGGSAGGGVSGGGSVQDLDLPEWVGNPLENIDFANHPALQSALDTFAKTSLPGIENAMIGAGLGASGAAGNAIATGKANIALPVMQQLLNLEMQNKGLDVGQRGTDIGAQVSARGQDASLAGQGMAASNALQQAQLAQQTAMRGQDINALLGQGSQALQARGQDINALLSGGQGLSSLGGMDVSRIQDAINQAASQGGNMRDIANQGFESQFMAENRPYDRMLQALGMFSPGAMAAGGTQTVTTGGGGK